MEMDFETFVDKVAEGVQEKLDIGCHVARRTVTRCNGMPRMGLVIETPEYNMSPVIFTDFYYELCKDENDIPLVVADILKTDEKCRGNFPTVRLLSWENVRRSVFFHILNTDKNKGLLAQAPHKDYPELGLSMVFRVPVENGRDRASILIKNEWLEQWRVDTEELAACALANMPVQWKASLQDMPGIIDEAESMGKEVEGKAYMDVVPMYVLTNTERLYGASCIFYPEMLEETVARFGSDYYVLPSSLHEVILLKAEEYNENRAAKLQEMVREINGSELAEEEVLADCVYYYRRETHEFFRC